MPTPSPLPVRGHRLQAESGAKPNSLKIQPGTAFRPEIERTYWVEVWEYLNGEGGVSLLISVGLHGLLLVALAIPIMRSIQKEEFLTTVIQNAPMEDFVSLSAPGGFDSALESLEVPSQDSTRNEMTELEMLGPAVLPSADPLDMPMLPSATTLSAQGAKKASGKGKGNGQGDGIGDGSGFGMGTGRMIEPKNAVRAGNFSVWPWPILGKDPKGRILHGDPGSSPKLFQQYHIVIRIRVPEGKKSVNLADFSGSVLGTDTYFQKIPQDAWFFNEDGDLVRARTGRSIPVIDGTAELLIRVPASATPSTRDTIKVSSRLTDEEQTIQLQFQDLNQ